MKSLPQCSFSHQSCWSDEVIDKILSLSFSKLVFHNSREKIILFLKYKYFDNTLPVIQISVAIIRIESILQTYFIFSNLIVFT